MLIFKIIFGGSLAKIIVNKLEKNRERCVTMTVQHRGIFFALFESANFSFLRLTRKHTVPDNVITRLNQINRSPMQIMSE